MSLAVIVGFNHAQISVPPGSDPLGRHFYGQVLGLTEMPVPPALQGRGLIWFKVGNLELHVGVEEGVNRLATRAHIAYEAADIARLRDTFRAQGLELFEQPKIEGFDRFHINDPFGNRVEFIGRLSQ